MFYEEYFKQYKTAIDNLDIEKLELLVNLLVNCKNKKGRLYIIGIGGSAGNASHAVNDFRKLCEIETYTPIDNISEITAKTNDEGFDKIFNSYLKLNKISSNDVILIFSVGGGNLKKKVSVNLINAIKFAKKNNSKIVSIVGKKGYAFLHSDLSIYIDIQNKNFITPVSESMQSIIWHLLVSHPKLQVNKTKW